MAKYPLLKVWTDGSCNEQGKPQVLGMGAVICYRGSWHKDEPVTRGWRVEANRTSSMHAEIFAIQCALESISLAEMQVCRLLIITDCLNIVHAIKSEKISRRYLKMIRHIKALMHSSPRASVVWCKAHNNHQWNELANEIARKQAGTWKGSV